MLRINLHSSFIWIAVFIHARTVQQRVDQDKDIQLPHYCTRIRDS